MNIESITTGQSNYTRTSSFSPGAEQLQRGRVAAQSDPSASASAQVNKANQPQPEELLQSIKALTDSGAYSVRFEMHKETNDMVINLIDQKSGEVIRQIPAKAALPPQGD